MKQLLSNAPLGASVAKATGFPSLDVIHAHSDATLTTGILELNRFLGHYATDLLTLETSVGKLLKTGTEKSYARAEQLMHAFYSITTFYTNHILDCLGQEGMHHKLISTLEDVRSNVGAVRFLPGENVKEAWSALMRDSWIRLGELGLMGEKLHVRQYDSSTQAASAELIERLADICDHLVINPGLQKPQMGYGRRVPASEISEMLATPGASLHVLNLSGQDVGFFIKFGDPEFFSPHVKGALQQCFQKEGQIPQKYSWLPLVGILSGASHELARAGIDSYKVLSNALFQTALLDHTERLYGEVRVGEQANLARASHLRIGLKSTNVIVQHGETPYEVLTIDPRDIGVIFNARAERDDLLSLSAGTESKRLPSLRTILDQWDGRDAENVKAAEYCALNGTFSKEAKLIKQKMPAWLRYDVLECSDGLAVQFQNGGSLYTIRQLIPNQDLWTSDFKRDFRRVEPFTKALENVLEEVSRR